VLDRFRLAWTPRRAPLSPRAVAATGEAARALGRRVAALDDAALAGLGAVAGDHLLVVVGAAAALPWVEDVTYLGCDPDAPDLLLPTAFAPSLPAPVLQHALRARLRTAAAPLAVLGAVVVPCGGARAIDRGRLAAWVSGARA